MSINRLIKKDLTDTQISNVLHAFFGSIEGSECYTINQGNINDTFLVINNEKVSFIVQRINGAVFPLPEHVAENTALVSEHICRTQNKADVACFPEVLTTLSGLNFYKDNQGSIWRAQKYIENTTSYEKVKNPRQALEVGKCLGRFHKMVQGMPPAALTTTLPHFHNLPRYISKFNSAWSAFSAQSSDRLQFCLDCVNENKNTVSFFEDALQCGNLQLAVTHGDPKIANILFDKKSDKALTLIDLDTVGPGLILQDLGDCLRSCCSRTEENAYDDVVECEPVYAAQAVAGYLEENDLSRFEQEHLYTALHLITFELGVRFLADYLEGNRYFKVRNSDDNLHRALIQFRLVRSIEERQDILCSMLEDAAHQQMKRTDE